MHESCPSATPDLGTDRPLNPIFISINEAARILALTPWSTYKLCDAGLLRTQWQGDRRLVRYASVLTYADSLPAERPAVAL